MSGNYVTKEHRLVPVEPTEEMIEAGHKALMDWDARTGEDIGIIEVYQAMLEAAPAAVKVKGDQVSRVFSDPPFQPSHRGGA